jgi:amino acid transporter
LALVSVLWAYDGWADLAFISGEVENPGRNLPRALIWGTVAVIVIYLLANIAYLGVMSVEEVRHSKLVAADVAMRLVGPAGVTFVAITVMLSTLGTLNGSILTNPRVFFAMAADGMLFRKVADVHPRFQTPYVAITLTAVLGIVFVMLRTFEQLADTFVTAILPFYALGVASIFVFRKRSSADYRPTFRTPLYPLTPILFVLAAMYLLVNALIDPVSRWPTLSIFVVILLGVPVYYATGDTVPPGPPSADVTQIIYRVDSIGMNVAALSLALKEQFVDAGTLKELNRTVMSASALSLELQRAIREQNANMTTTMHSFADAANHMSHIVDSAQVNATLANLQATSANAARLTANIDSTNAQLRMLIAQAQNGNGTIGKLMGDSLLYSDIRHTVASLDSLLTDFKKNPKKYINLRIF